MLLGLTMFFVCICMLSFGTVYKNHKNKRFDIYPLTLTGCVSMILGVGFLIVHFILN